MCSGYGLMVVKGVMDHEENTECVRCRMSRFKSPGIKMGHFMGVAE